MFKSLQGNPKEYKNSWRDFLICLNYLDNITGPRRQVSPLFTPVFFQEWQKYNRVLGISVVVKIKKKKSFSTEHKTQVYLGLSPLFKNAKYTSARKPETHGKKAYKGVWGSFVVVTF